MSSTSTAGAPPLTMADWAARQRALKEQDRKSKTASAEALRNYRGVGALRGEETLLATLKEQDRKKKEETAEQMRHYRGGGLIREEDTKLAMMRMQDRQQKQDAEQMLHDYREKESDVKNQTRPEHSKIVPDAVYSGGRWNPEEDIVAGSVSNIRESFNASMSSSSQELPPSPSRSRGGGNNMMARDPTPTAAATIVPSGQTPEPAVERSKFFASNHHQNSTTIIPNKLQQPQQVPPSPPINNNNYNNKKISNGHSSVPTPLASTIASPAATLASPAAATLASPPTTTTTTTTTLSLKRLDVKFSFGIVSLADTPSLEGYMNAVKEIVEQGLIDDANNLSQHVSWNAEFPPFVNEVEKDDTYKDPSGRSNVKRFLVKASVPIFVKSGFSSQSARRGVIAVLQQAIQNGVLLASAAASGGKMM